MLIFSIIVFYFFVRLWLSDTEKTNIVKWENIGGHEFVVLAKFLQFLQSIPSTKKKLGKYYGMRILV